MSSERKAIELLIEDREAQINGDYEPSFALPAGGPREAAQQKLDAARAALDELKPFE